MIEILFISFALIIIGSFSTLLSAAILYANHQTLEQEIGKKPSRLQKIKNNPDESATAYFCAESIFHVSAIVLLAVEAQLSYNEWYITMFAALAAFIGAFLLRSMFFGIGRRFSDYIIRNTGAAALLFFYIGFPIFVVTKFLKTKIGGISVEEASLEELSAMVESAREEGSIDQDEYRILKNIIKFRDVLVSDVMTPRTIVFSMRADMTVAEALSMQELQMYSRFPVWEGESIDDKILGYVMTREVLLSAIKGRNKVKIGSLAREIDFIPDNAELDKALDLFLEKKQHIFLVVDEWGGIEGLITMEDVMETMLGVEIVDEADKFVDLREIAKQRRDQRIASMSGA